MYIIYYLQHTFTRPGERYRRRYYNIIIVILLLKRCGRYCSRRKPRPVASVWGFSQIKKKKNRRPGRNACAQTDRSETRYARAVTHGINIRRYAGTQRPSLAASTVGAENRYAS